MARRVLSQPETPHPLAMSGIRQESKLISNRTFLLPQLAYKCYINSSTVAFK